MPGISGSGSDSSNSILGTVASAIPIVGGIYNAISQGAQNRKNRQFAQHMYDQQRADALADWDKQNSYNSPEQQMQRLKEAGLNPNEVYGHGADAMSTGTVRSSTPGASYGGRAPELNLGNAAASMIGLQIQKQQLANLRTQNTVMAADAAQKTANTDFTITKDNLGSFDLAYKQENRATSLAQQGANLQNTLARTDYTLSETDRRNALQASNLQQAAVNVLRGKMDLQRTAVEIERLRAVIKNLQDDDQLKQLSISMQEKGIMPGDPMYMRMLSRIIGSQTADSNLLNSPGESGAVKGSVLGDLFGTYKKGVKPW